MVTGAIRYGSETIRYAVQFQSTRRTLGIEVHPDLRVLVRAPEGCSEALIAERVGRRAAWISRQLTEFERYRPRTPPRQFIGGESHLYRGRQYRLRIEDGDVAGVRLAPGRLVVTVVGSPRPERVQALLHRWYLDRAGEVFSETIDRCLPRVRGVDRPRLIVRAMRSRWGSLSRNGAMTLNASLVRAPGPCIEYVVTHELCHLRYRDHDARFYRLLGQVMPDWQRRKERLEAALL